jgi:hypothetical protein
LTPLDFFLFSHLKNVVFGNSIDELQELQQTTEDAIANGTGNAVFNNFNRRE